MLDEICADIRNYFTYKGDILSGDYTIEGGVISPSIDFKGSEYIRITGSRHNNGVHKVDDMELEDEQQFHGSIWLMSPPNDFLSIVTEIEAWQAKNGGIDSVAMSPFDSESFGGYSYSKSNGGASGGASNGWRSVYASRLNRWRRIRL